MRRSLSTHVLENANSRTGLNPLSETTCGFNSPVPDRVPISKLISAFRIPSSPQLGPEYPRPHLSTTRRSLHKPCALSLDRPAALLRVPVRGAQADRAPTSEPSYGPQQSSGTQPLLQDLCRVSDWPARADTAARTLPQPRSGLQPATP